MELKEFFKPVSVDKELQITNLSNDSWIRKMSFMTGNSDYDNKKIVIMELLRIISL